MRLLFFPVDSPPRIDDEVVENIKTEYIEDSRMMDADYYCRVAEPQVDIIQSCDAQTQTDRSPEQLILQKLHALENSIIALKEDCRKDRETQNTMMQKQFRRMLDNQRALMEDFFGKSSAKSPHSQRNHK